jgi:hypothetical protein
MAMRRMKKASGMKKAMKKSMKAMKSGMRRRAMKKSIVGKRRSVFSGKKVKTSSGLKRSDLKKNKAGKIVSRRASDATRKGKGYKKIMAWSAATKAARKALGIKGFQAVGGKTAKGQALLKKVRSLYRK